MAGFCFWFLLMVCLVQFVFIANLMVKLQNKILDIHVLNSKICEVPFSNLALPIIPEVPVQLMTLPPIISNSTSLTTNSLPKVYGGVAATLLLHAPAWFQRRYTMMIQNTIANIPDDWVVQIFYTAAGQSKKGIDLNPGIQRFIKSGVFMNLYALCTCLINEKGL